MVPHANTSLDYAERWLRDGLHVLRPSLMVYQTTVDMSRALGHLEDLRKQGVSATSTHLLVRAAARALAANPDLHQIIGGTTRQRPDRVDIGLSITGETFVDPVLVIEGAELKSVAEIAAEIARRAPQVRSDDARMLGILRRWGWLLPFAFLRRALLRVLFTSPTFRRKGAGTFQVSAVPVEWAAGATFSTAGLLVGGGTSSRVLVVNGEPTVRPAMTLTLCGDHGVWDGRAAARILAAAKAELESW